MYKNCSVGCIFMQYVQMWLILLVVLDKSHCQMNVMQCKSARWLIYPLFFLSLYKSPGSALIQPRTGVCKCPRYVLNTFSSYLHWFFYKHFSTFLLYVLKHILFWLSKRIIQLPTNQLLGHITIICIPAGRKPQMGGKKVWKQDCV